MPPKHLSVCSSLMSVILPARGSNCRRRPTSAASSGAYKINSSSHADVERWKKDLPHLKVVMGGPHPSHDLEPLYQREIVDATIKAEAEYAMLDLVEAWAAGRSITGLRTFSWFSDEPTR